MSAVLHDPATDRAPERAVGVSGPRITDQFVWSREVPPEWEQRLREVSPVSDEISWLHLAWEPGERWVPGQRWVLYEMLHHKWADPERVAALRGPNPRLAGHYCSTKVPGQFQCLCRRKLEAWRGSNNPGITLTEWRLFRATGGYVGNPFLVLQGPKGAHRLRYSQFESELLALHGKPSDPPVFGSLEYAPFDERTVRLITQHNRLAQMQSGIQSLAAERDAAEREFRRQLVEHLDTELTDAQDLFIKAMDRGEMDGMRRTDINYERYAKEAIPQYIETGRIAHHSKFH